MLALCLMLSVTYYALNYAGMIGWSLVPIHRKWISRVSETIHPAFNITVALLGGFLAVTYSQ